MAQIVAQLQTQQNHSWKWKPYQVNLYEWFQKPKVKCISKCSVAITAG